MTPDSGRQIDPIFNDLGPSISDFDLSRLLVDDGRTVVPQRLDASGSGTPRTGDWVSRPTNPGDDPAPGEGDFDASMLAHPFRDIVLVSGDGDAPTLLDRPVRSIFPGAQDGFDLSGVVNGGPGGISDEKKKGGIPEYTKDDWVRDSEAKKAAAAEAKQKNTLQTFKENPDLYGKAVEVGTKENNNSIVETVGNAIKSAVKFTDPEQSQSGEGFDPHAMINDLLGDGPLVSDRLGIDVQLVGRMLGDKPKPQQDQPKEGEIRQSTTGDETGGSGGALIQTESRPSHTPEEPGDGPAGRIAGAVNVLDSFFALFGGNGFDGGITMPENGKLDGKWLDALLDQFGLDAFADVIDMPAVDLDANSLFFEFGIEQDNDLFLLVGDHDSLVALVDIAVDPSTYASLSNSAREGFANVGDHHRDWY